MIVTEKIDGTNGSLFIGEAGEFYAGSRTRWITPSDDNYGFARWAYEHREELIALLGPGHHFGEWWGSGIQRRYDVPDKRFSLFNVSRWTPEGLASTAVDVRTVPVLWRGPFDTAEVDRVLETLKAEGSRAAPGFMKPEGVVVYHTKGQVLFKKTIEKDAEPKGRVAT
jgi:hypothetical protein